MVEMMVCSHHGQKPIVEWSGKRLFGASSSGLTQAVDRNHAACVVDLANVWSGANVTLTVLTLDWPDGEAPPAESFIVKPKSDRRFYALDALVGLNFWKRLWEPLPEGTTVVACVGGHGRTGTFLAAMLIAAHELNPSAAHEVNPREAVRIVRETYCSKAIETKVQEKYLESLGNR